MHAPEHVGIRGDSLDEAVKHLAELLPETRAPRVVPGLHFKDIVYGLGPKDDLPQRHLRSELRPYDRPRNRRPGIREVISPTTIEFRELIFREHKIGVALTLAQAVPKGHRERSPIAGR